MLRIGAYPKTTGEWVLEVDIKGVTDKKCYLF